MDWPLLQRWFIFSSLLVFNVSSLSKMTETCQLNMSEHVRHSSLSKVAGTFFIYMSFFKKCIYLELIKYLLRYVTDIKESCQFHIFISLTTVQPQHSHV